MDQREASVTGSLPSPSPFTSRPGGRWPGRPLLVARLREILRREYDADDAWVVHSKGWCRLEARSAWRVIVLMEGHEDTFWARFYTAAVRHRRVGGQMVGELAPTQRRRSELTQILRPLWAARYGGIGCGAGHLPVRFV